MTVYFGGGVSGAIVFAAALAALIYFAVKKRKAVLCAVGAVCGAVVMMLYTALYVEPVLEFAGKTVSARIYVQEVAKSSELAEEIIAGIKLDGRSTKVRLSCPEPLAEDSVADVTVSLEKAEDSSENLAWGILLSGTVESVSFEEYRGTGASAFFRGLREEFCGRLYGNLDGESEEMASLILFGEESRATPKIKEQLRVSGAAHYTAVSGSHFAVLAAAVLMLIPNRRRWLRVLFSLMFAPLGLLFYGFSPSVIRASAMFLVHGAAELLHRRSHPLNSLCAAVSVISFFSPQTVLDVGFAMSALGVLGVGVIGPALSEKLREFIPNKAEPILPPVVTVVSCSVCASISTAPICAAVFKSVSLVGWLTSLIFAPIMAVSMIFMLILGMSNLVVCAVPIHWLMKLAAAAAELFGGNRALSLPLGYKGAWVLPTVLALLIAIASFSDLKAFVKLLKATVLPLALIAAASVIIVSNRCEVRFVGNTYSSAAIVFNKNTAAVFISGGGDGLSESVSSVLRQYGAVKITRIAAYDADYGGALAVKELSEMLPVETVLTNDLAAGLLPELNTEPPPEDSSFSECGAGFASVSADSPDITADIALYSGVPKIGAENSSKIVVYFANAEEELPENFRNARIDREFRVKLKLF